MNIYVINIKSMHQISVRTYQLCGKETQKPDFFFSGSTIMQDGSTIRNGYALDLDSLAVGSYLAMEITDDGELHYFLDGEDMGPACTDLPSGE